MTVQDEIVTVSSATRRKAESRRKLLAAARQLFVERGYHDTRPQDISRLAGVGHGTFYLHFHDKLDCFLAFADEAADELDTFLQTHLISSRTLEDGIRVLLEAIFRYSSENPGVLAAALTDITVLTRGDTGMKTPIDRWAESWAGLMDHWKEEGQAFPELDSRMAGYLIVGAIREGGAYGHRRKLDREGMIDSMTSIFVRSLRK